MKYFIFSIFSAFLFVTINTTYSLTVVYIYTPGGGLLRWSEAKGYCPDAGHFCIKKVTQVTNRGVNISDDVTLGGTFITTTFGGMTFDVTNDPTYGTFSSIHDGKNYPFQADDYINIVSSDEHPSLNGLSFSLDGIITDSNGEFTTFVIVP